MLWGLLRTWIEPVLWSRLTGSTTPPSLQASPLTSGECLPQPAAGGAHPSGSLEELVWALFFLLPACLVGAFVGAVFS